MMQTNSIRNWRKDYDTIFPQFCRYSFCELLRKNEVRSKRHMAPVIFAGTQYENSNCFFVYVFSDLNCIHFLKQFPGYMATNDRTPVGYFHNISKLGRTLSNFGLAYVIDNYYHSLTNGEPRKSISYNS